MKNVLQVSLWLFLFGLMFTACSSDDPKPGPGPGPGTGDTIVLSAPENLYAECTAEDANVGWDTVANAKRYEIALNNGDVLTTEHNYYAFMGLSPQTDYEWKVRAVRDSVVSDWAKHSFTTTSGDTVTYANLWAGSWTGKGVTATGKMTINFLLESDQAINFNDYLKALDEVDVTVDVRRVEDSKEISFALAGLDTLFDMPEFTVLPKKTTIAKSLPVDNLTREIVFAEPFKLADMLDNINPEDLGQWGGMLGDLDAYINAFKAAEITQVNLTVSKLEVSGSLANENTAMALEMKATGMLTFKVEGLQDDLLKVFEALIKDRPYELTIKPNALQKQ